MRLIARALLLTSLSSFSFHLAAAEPLRVGVSPDYEPLAYKHDGDLAGIDIAAAEVLGKLMNRKVKFVETDFGKLIPALEAGQIDIIMSGMSITAERSQRVDFSNPYLDAGQTAIIRFADAGRLSFRGALFQPGAKVVVEKGTTGEAFARERLKSAEVIASPSLNQAFAMLKEGKVDFLIHDAPTSWLLANDKNKSDLLSLNHALTDEQLGWAVRKDNQVLLKEVNAQLATMQSNGMLRAIVRQWIPVTVEVQDSMVRVPSSRFSKSGSSSASSQATTKATSIDSGKQR